LDAGVIMTVLEVSTGASVVVLMARLDCDFVRSLLVCRAVDEEPPRTRNGTELVENLWELVVSDDDE
jgi:hypothetical protein